MKIPKTPFVNEVHGQLLYVLLTGGECIGYEEIALDVSQVKSLTVPDGAVYALIVCEADASPLLPDKSKVIRYKQFDTQSNPPDASLGMPLGDLGVAEVKGENNLSAFRAVGITPGFTHILKVEYYG
jgi:hypothetical protein